MEIKDFIEIIKIEPLTQVNNCGRLIGCKPMSCIAFSKVTEDENIIAAGLQFRKSSLLKYEINEDDDYVRIKFAFRKEDLELLDCE